MSVRLLRVAAMPRSAPSTFASGRLCTGGGESPVLCSGSPALNLLPAAHLFNRHLPGS
jgi:hypothetical protein